MTTVARQGQPRLAALVIRLHQRYCTPFQVRAVWGILIFNIALMMLLAAWSTK